MVIALERPPRAPTPAPAQPAPDAASAAQELAGGYLGYASALWRGEPGAVAFGAWLVRFWCPILPPPPARPPEAVSPHGAGGRGIRWYAGSGEVLGYTPGAASGYRIPLDAIPRIADSPCRHWTTTGRRSASASVP